MPGGPHYSAHTNEHRNTNTNTDGGGQRVDTPFTSPPLHDDFDAITTQRWSRTTRATTVEPTCSALYDQLEAATRATTPATAGFTRRPMKKAAHGDEGQWIKSGKQQDAPVVVHARERGLRRMRGKDRIQSGVVRRAPPAGLDYEIVECRVLESGPERTVSISTWREQAIMEADSDDDMSVYYVNAEDCMQLAATPEIVVIPVAGESSGSNNSNGKKSGSRESGSRDAETHAEILVSSKSPHNVGSKPSRSADASMSLHSSGPRTSTPRGSGTLVVPNVDGQADITVATGFTPFHATRSGSTISSIRLSPSAPSPSPTLEHVLCACEPPLAHIAPMLQRVGIRGTEHLRAVGKLSEETRNREVREEVLRLGVTVVEWAILLDKLQSL